MTEPYDKSLDEYLRRESPVSQRYRELDADDVPPRLDAAVLAQARAAVANRGLRKPAWVKWGAPLALAASAVLAVAIVLDVGVRDEAPVLAPQADADAVQVTGAKRAQERAAMEEVTPEVATDLQRALRAPPAPAQEQAFASVPAPSEPAAKEAAPEARSASPAAGSARTAISATTAPVTPGTPGMEAAPRLPAQEWLERIRTLRREGKVLEADEQWREFRESYPEVAVSATDSAQPQPAP